MTYTSILHGKADGTDVAAESESEMAEGLLRGKEPGPTAAD